MEDEETETFYMTSTQIFNQLILLYC